MAREQSARRDGGGAGGSGSGGTHRTIVRRIVIAVVAIGALVFAVEGGEFSTFDLLRQRRQKARLTASIDSARRVVDSLKRYDDKVLNDPATQERIAREVFGMVRGNKELLYRFSDAPDSGATGAAAKRDTAKGDTAKRPPA